MLKLPEEKKCNNIYELNMQQEKILQNLENILADLDVELRYEKGDFDGGFCRYEEKKQIIVNRNLKLDQKITVIASELRANFDLNNLFLVPALREVIENASGVG